MFGKKGKDDNEPTGTEPEDYSGTDASTGTERDTTDFTGTSERTDQGTGEGLGSVKIPDVFGKVLGFKIFKCYTSYQNDPTQNSYGATEANPDHYLQSPYMGTEWVNGYMTGKVDGLEGGVYAWHKPRKSMSNELSVTHIRYQGQKWEIPAVVQAWGEIEVYETGFRAEHMQVVLLAYCEDWRFKDVTAYARWAKKYYDADIASEQNLWKEGLTYCSPIPDELKPTKRDINEYWRL